MAHKISWEPMPPLRGKLSKNTKVIYKRNSVTKEDYTSVARPRNLQTHPYSDKEIFQHVLFQMSASSLNLPTDEEIAAFKNQKKYKTLRGFIVASRYRKFKELYATSESFKNDTDNTVQEFRNGKTNGLMMNFFLGTLDIFNNED